MYKRDMNDRTCSINTYCFNLPILGVISGRGRGIKRLFDLLLLTCEERIDLLSGSTCHRAYDRRAMSSLLCSAAVQCGSSCLSFPSGGTSSLIDEGGNSPFFKAGKHLYGKSSRAA